MTIEWPTHRDGSGRLTRPTSVPRGVTAETPEQERLRTADLAREIRDEQVLSGTHDEHARTRSWLNPEQVSGPRMASEPVDWANMNEYGEPLVRIPTERQEVEITSSWQQANRPHR